MSDWLRRAGRGRLPDGAEVTWTVAEGGRGRRWRWTVVRGGELQSSALVELAVDGRFARLELARPEGLLTFHPEADGRSAHGNVVTAGGVGPISVSWQPGWGIGFEADPFGTAVGGWRGSGLVLGPGLSWRLAEVDIEVLPLDERAIPLLETAEEWPLEEPALDPRHH